MSDVIRKGDLALVEVLGLPGSNTAQVFPYRLHADMKIGGIVLVPAPAWSVRVTGRNVLPGFVLGVPSPDFTRDLTPSQIKFTIPSPATAADVDPEGNMRVTLTTWRAQAVALTNAARLITRAADDLERALST